MYKKFRDRIINKKKITKIYIPITNIKILRNTVINVRIRSIKKTNINLIKLNILKDVMISDLN